MQRDLAPLKRNLSDMVQAETFAVDQQGIHIKIIAADAADYAESIRAIRAICGWIFTVLARQYGRQLHKQTQQDAMADGNAHMRNVVRRRVLSMR